MLASHRIFLAKALAVSGTDPVVLAVVQLDAWKGFSLQLVTTSTLHGDWKIEACNDYDPNGLDVAVNTGSWKDVTSWFDGAGGPIVTVTAASNQLVQAYPFCFQAFRVTFTPSSSSGTISAIANEKA
jgi:hypothetical protein